MKPGIHPQFHTTAKIVCACGNTFQTGSILAESHTEICSSCHPYFTGKQNLIDTTGAVDKFKKRLVTAQAKISSAKPKKERKSRIKK